MEITTLKIDKNIRNELKEIAAKKGRPMQELTEKAITDYIRAEHKDDRPK